MIQNAVLSWDDDSIGNVTHIFTGTWSWKIPFNGIYSIVCLKDQWSNANLLSIKPLNTWYMFKFAAHCSQLPHEGYLPMSWNRILPNKLFYKSSTFYLKSTHPGNTDFYNLFTKANIDYMGVCTCDTAYVCVCRLFKAWFLCVFLQHEFVRVADKQSRHTICFLHMEELWPSMLCNFGWTYTPATISSESFNWERNDLIS